MCRRLSSWALANNVPVKAAAGPAASTRALAARRVRRPRARNISTDAGPPSRVAFGSNGLPAGPHGDGGRDLLIFLGEAQPPLGKNAYCRRLIEYAQELGRSVRGLSPAAMASILAHSWPGNVRELQNCLKRAVASAASPVISARDLRLSGDPEANDGPLTLKQARFDAESRALRQALAVADGNISEAARVLEVAEGTARIGTGGALEVMDWEPRTLAAHQWEALQALARQAMAQRPRHRLHHGHGVHAGPLQFRPKLVDHARREVELFGKLLPAHRLPFHEFLPDPREDRQEPLRVAGDSRGRFEGDAFDPSRLVHHQVSEVRGPDDPDRGTHPHFVCTVCGSVSCLPDAAVTGLDGGPQRTPPKRPVEVHLRGVCDNCDP